MFLICPRGRKFGSFRCVAFSYRYFSVLRNALFGKISHSLHSSMPIALAYKKGRLVNGRLDLETALWIVTMGGEWKGRLCVC